MRYEIELPARAGEHGVYVFLDDAQRRLYVGMTSNLPKRAEQHSHSAVWWHRVRSVEWIPTSTRLDARELERALIADFSDGLAHNINDRRPLPSVAHRLPAGTQALLRALYAEESDAGLPRGRSELTAYLSKLRAAGWTLAALGGPLSMTREAVRQRLSTNERDECVFPITLPPALHGPAAPRRDRRAVEAVPADVAAEIRQMNESTRGVVRHSSAADKERSALYSARLAELVAEGYSITAIARAAGVTRAAIQMRLGRHGHMPAYASQSHVRFGQFPDSLMTHCKRGHELSGDNVRLINGDPRRRTCRACERIRVAAYQERQRAGAA